MTRAIVMTIHKYKNDNSSNDKHNNLKTTQDILAKNYNLE